MSESIPNLEQVKSHRDLQVWQMSMDLAQAIYRLTGQFPKQEEYRITSQIIRAAISIPANIAEGNARVTRKDYAHFVSIARGSTAELETLLLLAQRAGFDRENAIAPLIETNERIGKMLTSLRSRLADGAQSSRLKRNPASPTAERRGAMKVSGRNPGHSAVQSLSSAS